MLSNPHKDGRDDRFAAGCRFHFLDSGAVVVMRIAFVFIFYCHAVCAVRRGAGQSVS